MQKFWKMEVRRSVVVMVPVMAERWWMVSRRSWAMKSPERFARRPSRTRANDSAASVRAS